jgi:hypothetical protein
MVKLLLNLIVDGFSRRTQEDIEEMSFSTFIKFSQKDIQLLTMCARIINEQIPRSKKQKAKFRKFIFLHCKSEFNTKDGCFKQEKTFFNFFFYEEIIRAMCKNVCFAKFPWGILIKILPSCKC